MSVQRIALGVRYDGSAYCGWQWQSHELATIQYQLEKALSHVANHTVSVFAAGRTDAGVHATGQVVHFDTEAERSEYSWIFGVNSNLPSDISIAWAHKVGFNFHARQSATARRYRYVIYNHPIRPAILRQAVTWHHRPLDEKLMHQAAQHLLGEHDFSAFRALGCQAKSPVRKIYEIKVTRHQFMVIIDIKASAFLQHMVRNIAGVLLPIGEGNQAAEWVLDLLACKDRKQAGVTAPPHGLYLVKVEYSKEFVLPQAPMDPFFLT